MELNSYFAGVLTPLDTRCLLRLPPQHTQPVAAIIRPCVNVLPLWRERQVGFTPMRFSFQQWSLWHGTSISRMYCSARSSGWTWFSRNHVCEAVLSIGKRDRMRSTSLSFYKDSSVRAT